MPRGNYMHHLLQQLTILHFPMPYIYVFRTILTVNSDYFLKQRYPVDLCNGEVRCFLCGKNDV
jgi:hypothetical protein